MAAKPMKGTRQVNAEIDAELLDRLKAFAEERGQTLRYVIERAITRHLENPPPMIPDPPLPDSEPDRAPAPKKLTQPRKGKK